MSERPSPSTLTGLRSPGPLLSYLCHLWREQRVSLFPLSLSEWVSGCIIASYESTGMQPPHRFTPHSTRLQSTSMGLLKDIPTQKFVGLNLVFNLYLCQTLRHLACLPPWVMQSSELSWTCLLSTHLLNELLLGSLFTVEHP